mmetsp:Transcript_28386/g.64938  ORF Transcript_28386/g.64938 Transcript_28386/m.64938 type:complete len:80 (-) Transcript_28386:195-434(-)
MAKILFLTALSIWKHFEHVCIEVATMYFEVGTVAPSETCTYYGTRYCLPFSRKFIESCDDQNEKPEKLLSERLIDVKEF